MVPLKTIQGLTPYQLRELINLREVYIWGTGVLSFITLASLKASGINIKGFLDNRNTFVGRKFKKYSIFHVSEILQKKSKRDIFIVISSGALLNYARSYLQIYNLIENTDFINYIKLSRPTVAIDIYSGCNLKCTSCPQGNIANIRKEISMPFDTYKLVLDKLLIEIPLLSCIEFFTWGEPLLNNDLPKIIEYTQKKEIPSIISTNLQNINILEDVLKQQPTALYITVNGIDKEYETHTQGASWEVLLNNLINLSFFVKKYTLETIIEVKIYIYKNSLKEQLEKFIDFCEEINLKSVVSDTYLNPYDNYLNFCQGKEISHNAKQNLENNIFSFHKVLELAKKDIDLPCLSQRIFPIINADLTIGLCHTFYNPIIADNFLKISWEDLLKIRHNQVQCEWCQFYALHRFDLEILKRKYFLEMNKIKGL